MGEHLHVGRPNTSRQIKKETKYQKDINYALHISHIHQVLQLSLKKKKGETRINTLQALYQRLKVCKKSEVDEIRGE
jgi:hypothetical protein